ncbi:MAG TPA: AraC family transcriptional regulator [Steroidobacteraceae bacterium]|nr:AraC family transcriptional regulator [Steroidobacteraceae bacterium]
MTRDTLSDLLRSVRLRGAAFYYVSFRGQWSAGAAAAKEIAHVVMPGCDHVMEYHMFAKGNGWAAVDGLAPVRLQAGDLVLFPQGDRHVISSAPGLAAGEQRPELLLKQGAQRPLPISFHEGLVEVGSMAIESADAVVVCGFLGCDLQPFNPLIAALPRILHLTASRAGGWLPHAIDQAVLESNERRPGGDAVLERLSEMMFIDAARRYLESLPEESVGWLAGLRDRHVGKALALLHERPQRQWSVDELAREVGLSRSALHERFVRYLGQAPVQYLASWRIQLGAKLLRESSRIVADIALEVGYESEAAFARAFKRLAGMPPAAWRRAQAGNSRAQIIPTR